MRGMCIPNPGHFHDDDDDDVTAYARGRKQQQNVNRRAVPDSPTRHSDDIAVAAN